LIANGKFSIPSGPDPETSRKVGSVPTFAQYNPKGFKSMTNDFVAYIKHISSIEKGTVPAAKEITFRLKDVQLDESGVPRVPDPIRNVNNIETNLTQQQIIHAYFTKHYSV